MAAGSAQEDYLKDLTDMIRECDNVLKNIETGTNATNGKRKAESTRNGKIEAK